MAFTFYVGVYDFFNLIGHFLKIIAFYFIYKAVIETGLSKPYGLLFRNLKQQEESLREREEWLRVTLTSIGDAVIATDTARNITFMNTVAEELTGWTLADAAKNLCGKYSTLLTSRAAERLKIQSRECSGKG